MKFLILFVAFFGSGLAFLFAGGPEEGECGCCPHPCCCVCIDQEQTLPPTTTSTTTTSTTTTTTTTTTTSTTTPFVPVCNATQEVVIIVDSSGSIGTVEWDLAKQFVKNVVDSFEVIGEGGSRVALITFSTNATVWWTLADDETSSKRKLMNAIDAVPREGQFTNTPEALQFANNRVFNSPGDDPDIPNVAVIITDGRHTHGRNIFEQVAADLQESATVIAVGVTNEIDQEDLETMATGDGAENTFRVTNFEALKDILNALVEKTCTEEPVRPTTTPKPTKAPKTTTPRPTRAPTTPRPTLAPKRECFCCCPPPPSGGIRPLNTCC